MTFEDCGRERLRIEAEARALRHADHASSRPLSPDYELVGLLGEAALADFCGGDVDFTARPRGDGGVDAWLHTKHGVYPADVKAARKAYHLAVEVNQIKRQTIYMLGQLEHEYLGRDKMWVRLLGWQWSAVLRKTKPRVFAGYSILNYTIPAGELRKMDELREFLIKG